MKKEKITKVVLEYETYRTILTGKQAEEWLSAADGACVINAVHGMTFPQFKWKREKVKW